MIWDIHDHDQIMIIFSLMIMEDIQDVRNFINGHNFIEEENVDLVGWRI